MITHNQNLTQRPDVLVKSAPKTINAMMLLIMGYFMVEYLRPPFLNALRPAVVIQLLFLAWFITRLGKLRVVLRDTYFKLYIAMMALMSIHLFIALNNFWAFQQWKVMLTYLIFALAFCSVVDTPKRLKAAVSTFIIFHAVCALNRMLGIYYFGMAGPLGDTNDFALAMNVVMPLSFYVGLHHSGAKRWVYWVFCLVFVVGNVMCASRGGFLGMAAVALAIIGLSRYKVKAIVALLALSLVFWALIPSSFKTEIQSIRSEGAESGTGKERIELWKVAGRGFLDNPVIGLGQGNMPFRMPDYQYDRSGKSFFHRELWSRSVHSIYFTALPELGAVGFLLWIWLLMNLYGKFKTMKTIDPDALAANNDATHKESLGYIRHVGFGMIIGIFGHLVSGVFLSAFYYPSFWNLSAMLTAGCLIKKRLENQT